MGGKGSGGARIGSGPKRKSAKAHWLTGDAGKRGLAVVPPRPVHSKIAGSEPVETAKIVAFSDAPAALVDAERDFWALWSPLAKANGTLTPDTTPGFVLLCQVASRAADLWTRAKDEGFVLETPLGKKAHPLLTHYRGLMQRQEQLLARYGLAVFGKATSKAAESPEVERDRAELARLLAIR